MYNQSVKQFGSRSGLTFCKACSGPNCLQKLSAEDTSRQRVILTLIQGSHRPGKSMNLTLVLENYWNLKKVPFVLEIL